MINKEWFFYIVKCKDDSFYSGITVKVEERVKQHNNGTGARYTLVHGPVTLVYSEKHNNISDARKREAQIKKWPRIKKQRLIQGTLQIPLKMTIDRRIQEYIKKQKSPQKEICLKLRDIILKTFPDAKEEMKWGVPVFAGGKYYIGALKDHVNLGFSINGLAKEKLALFEGYGKTMRYIKIRILEDIDEKEIVKLLKIACECIERC